MVEVFYCQTPITDASTALKKITAQGTGKKWQTPMTIQAPSKKKNKKAAQTTTKPQELNVIQSQRTEFQFTQQKTSQPDRGYLKKKFKIVFCSNPLPSNYQPLALLSFF